MRTHPLVRLAALTVAAFVAVACHSDSPTAPKTSNNAFRADVTGAVTRTITGQTFAELFTDASGSEYDLVLSDGPFATASGGVILSHFGPVAVGTYTIGDFTGSDDEFVSVFVSTTDGDQYFSTGGSLVIESISASRVKGHFDMPMKSDDTGNTVQVTGTFDGANDGIPGANNSRASWVPPRGLVAARMAR